MIKFVLNLPGQTTFLLMDLNSIELTPELITSFYKNHLVDIQDEEAVSPSPITEEFQYLGENGKNILIVIPKAPKSILNRAQSEFLNSLLSACKLTMSDVVVMPSGSAVIPSASEGPAMINHFKSRIVILFGVDPLSIGLPIGFPQFQVQPFNNITYLYSPSLDEMINDKLLKSKLWICLKRIFNL